MTEKPPEMIAVFKGVEGHECGLCRRVYLKIAIEQQFRSSPAAFVRTSHPLRRSGSALRRTRLQGLAKTFMHRVGAGIINWDAGLQQGARSIVITDIKGIRITVKRGIPAAEMQPGAQVL